MKKSATINLEDYRTPGSKIFMGRDRGKNVKIQSQINELEAVNDEIYIIIPNNIYTILSHFFEELFRDVLRKLGKKKFYDKFKFVNHGSYNYNIELESAINFVLNEKSILD